MAQDFGTGVSRTLSAADPVQYRGLGGVYRLWVSPHHFYVGRSRDLLSRIRHHRNSLCRNAHSNQHMQNTFNKYGGFRWEIIALSEDRAEQVQIERSVLDDLYRTSGCLNKSDRAVGGCRKGPLSEKTKKKISETKQKNPYQATPEARARMSAAARGRPKTAAHVRNNAEAQKGKKLSPETKRKISESLKGRKPSPETVEKIRKANLGKKRTPEQKRRLSEGQKGKVLTPEHRQKISESLRGRKHSEEARRKMSVSQRGRTHSEETKAKIASARRAYFERKRAQARPEA